MMTIKIPPGEDLTPILKAHRNGARFELDAGVYFLDSAWAFNEHHDHCTLGPECQLVGAGSGRTSIVVDGAACLDPGAHQIICLTAGGRNGACRDIEISGVSILCPEPPAPPFRAVGIIGIQIWSGRCTIEDVDIYGTTGTLPMANGEPSREGFGILINESGKPPVEVGGSIVRDVTVKCQPNQNRGELYVTGFYPGYANPTSHGTYENILCKNETGYPASVAFGTNGRVVGRNWQCDGRWTRGIYCDVTGGSSTMISDSILEVESTAVELHTEDGKPSQCWEDIMLQNSVVRFRPSAANAYAAALVLKHGAGGIGEFRRVQLRGCQLINLGGNRIDHWAGSADSAKAVIECGLRRCDLIGQWLGQSTSNPGFTIV